MSEEGSAHGQVVLGLLSDTRVGRVFLWFIVALLLLFTPVVPPADREVPLLLATIPALLAVVGAVRQRRRERAAFMFGVVWRVALASVVLGTVGLLIWLRSRGRKAEAVPPPPLPEEVDQMARMPSEQERVA
jgi:hypothetical protein